MKVIVATKNKHKLTEFSRILEPLGYQLISQEEACPGIEVEEDGATFLENARKKAVEIFRRTGLPTIADDSGLCVDALNGAPGVYSARYGGEGLDDAGRRRLLLQNLRGQTTRAAHFTCAVACAFPNGDTLEAEGRCDGAIAFAPLGDGGFGYDPVFLIPEKGKTFGQIGPEEKSKISHRGKALAAFAEKLGAYLSKGEAGA